MMPRTHRFLAAATALTGFLVLACGSAIEAQRTAQLGSLSSGAGSGTDAASAVPLYRGYMLWNQDVGPDGEAFIQWSQSAPASSAAYGANLLLNAPYLADSNILSLVNIGSVSGAAHTYFSLRDSGLQTRVLMTLKAAGVYQDLLLGIDKTFLGQWLPYGGTNAVTGQTTNYYYWQAGDVDSTTLGAVAHFGMYNPSGTANVVFRVEVRGSAKKSNSVVVINSVTSGQFIDHPYGAKAFLYTGDSTYSTPDYLADSQRIVVSGSGLTEISKVTFRTETAGGKAGEYTEELLAIRTQDDSLLETEPPSELRGSIESNPTLKVVYLDFLINDGRTLTFPLKVGMRYFVGADTVAADVGHHTGWLVVQPPGLSTSGTNACPSGSWDATGVLAYIEATIPSVHTIYMNYDDVDCPGASGETFRILAGSDRNNSGSLNTGDSYVTGSMVIPAAGCGSINWGPDNLMLTTNRSVYGCTKVIPLNPADPI